MSASKCRIDATCASIAEGDHGVFRAHASKEGLPRIGFGECAVMNVGPNDGTRLITAHADG